MIKVDLQTQEAIEYLVRELPVLMKHKAIQEGVGNAAKIFESLGRSNLSHSIMGHGKQTGETMRSLTSKVTSARKRGSAPYSAAGFRRKIGWRAHLIDRGTGPRYTKTGAYRGFIIPTYFYEKARIEGEKPAMDVIIDGVQRAVARLSNRG